VHGADVVLYGAFGGDVPHGGDVVHGAHGADVVHVVHGADVVHVARGGDVVHGGEVGQGGGVGHGITMGKLYLIKEGNGSKLTEKLVCFTVSNPFTKTDRTKDIVFRLLNSNACISLKFSRALIE